MILVFSLLNVIAAVLLYSRGAPKAYPWKWAGAFALVLFVGAFYPLGTLERFVLFVEMTAAAIVGWHMSKHIHRAGTWIGIALAVFVSFDALRLLPTPDVNIAGNEIFGIIRRPYVIAHPNIAAAWSLLLPLGAWTAITVVVTQSRGALVGLLTASVMRFVPRRYMVRTLIAGCAMIALAIMLRPNTAFDRLTFWEEGTRLFLARPLTGWGSGSYRESYKTETPMNAITERTGMHTAHNALLTIAAENGIAGVVTFMGFAGSLALTVRRSDNPLKWGALAFAVQQIFDDQWLHPVTSILFGLVVGACLPEHPI